MRAVSPIKIDEIALVESNYLRETVVQIWEDMVVLLCGSLLVALAAVPMLLIFLLTGFGPLLATGLCTVAPSWVAYCYLTGRATIYGKAILADFFSALVHYYWRSCALALPMVIIFVMIRVSFPLLTSAPTFLFTVGIVCQIIALCLALSVFIFAAPILGLFQVKLFQAWTYGFVLMLRRPLVALGLISMAFLLVMAANALGLGVWLIIPLIFVPFEVNATLMLIKKTIELEKSRGAIK